MCFCTRTDFHRHELFSLFINSDAVNRMKSIHYKAYTQYIPCDCLRFRAEKDMLMRQMPDTSGATTSKEITTTISATTAAPDVDPTLNPCTVNSFKRNCSILSPLITNYQSNQMEWEFFPSDFFVVADPLFGGRWSNKSSLYLS